MKKFFVIILAAALCLALALPAMAKVTVGGRVALDWSYLSRNAERASGGVLQGSSPVVNGFDQMNFIAPITLNRFNAMYTSDDGALKAMVEIRGGGPDSASGSQSAYLNDAYMNYAYIEWQITPNNSITFGRQTTNFARFVPNQWVGTQATTILGVGFGNVNHTTARTGIKGYWRISDMFGLVWGLYQSQVARGQPGVAVVTAFGTPTLLPASENKLPRVDLALPIRFPWGRIEPSFTWSQASFDQVASGDDSYDMYGFSLGGEGSFGMFSFVAEVTYGQNLGAGNYRGAEGDIPVLFYNTATATATIADGSDLAWFVDLGFKFGPSKVDAMYGQIKYKNDNGPAALPTLYDYTQSFYGVSWAIGVAKGFTIRPELMFYDFDSGAKIGDEVIDRGKEWLLGIQFMLVF
jgi:hypothetical protein